MRAFPRVARALPAIVALIAAAPPSHALTFNIANGGAQIYLRIGQTGGTVSIVTFPVTAANAGTGIVAGTAPAAAGAFSPQTGNFPACGANFVRIVARARAPVANTRTATLSVTSTGSLSAGANTIPFTKFSWISDDVADLPGGAFLGVANQALVSFQNSREVGACHRFQFLNDTVYAPGTYNGTVTYNLAMP